MLTPDLIDRALLLANQAGDADLAEALRLERSVLVFVHVRNRLGRGSDFPLAVFRVGSPGHAVELTAQCSGVRVLHLLAQGAVLDVRTSQPALPDAWTAATHRLAQKGFREQLRRGLKELQRFAPLLASELRRTLKVAANVAFLQPDAHSPQLVTRDCHASSQSEREPRTLASSTKEPRT